MEKISIKTKKEKILEAYKECLDKIEQLEIALEAEERECDIHCKERDSLAADISRLKGKLISAEEVIKRKKEIIIYLGIGFFLCLLAALTSYNIL